MLDQITIAAFERTHLEGAHALSQAVFWPHKISDWAMLLEMSQGIVALAGDQVIGTALCTPFGSDVATANMIIVDAAHQGQGLGRRLMERVLPQTGACRLVATAEGLPLYEKLGFRATGTIRQHQGLLRQAPGPTDAGHSVRKAERADLLQVIALECKAYGADRTVLMQRLATDGRLFVLTGPGGITGYAARRPFGKGHVIGPVVAPGAEAAQALISAALGGLNDHFVRIDTQPDTGLVPWIEGLGLAHAGSGTAMQRGSAPAPAPRYALFSQALG